MTLTEARPVGGGTPPAQTDQASPGSPQRPLDRPGRQAIAAAAFRRYRFAGAWLGAGTLLGLMVDVVKGGSVLLPVVGGVAAVICCVLVVTPTASMVVLLVVEWSNLSDVVGYHSGLSLYFVSLGLSLVALVIAVRRSGIRPLPASPIYLLLVFLITAAAISLLSTDFRVVSTSVPTQRLKDVGFFFVALGLIKVTGRWRLALATMVITIAVLAGLSVVQEFVLHNSTTLGGLEGVPDTVQVGGITARHNGPQADPNFWGRTIVLAFAPGLALLLEAWRSRRRRHILGWALVAVSLLGGEYLTQSRGGFIAMLVVLVLWVVIAGWRHRRRLLLLPIGLVVVVVAVPGLASRLGSLHELTNVSASSTDPSLIGRIQAQKVAVAMFKSHPLTGVGIGEFQAVEPRFLADAGAEDTGTALAAHDLYLEIAAEQGTVGLVAWGIFFGGSIFIALRAALLAQRSRAGPERMAALGCLVGLIGWGAASAVLHMNYFGDLLAVIALAVVLDGEARSAGRFLTDAPPSAPPRAVPASRGQARWFAPVRLIVAALVGGAAALGIASTLPLHATSFRAEVTASVRPVEGPPSGDNAYTWDTVSRLWLLPTLGNVMSNRRFSDGAATELHLSALERRSASITGVGDAQDAILGVQVTAPDAGLATSLAERTFAGGSSYLSSLLSAYEIEPLSSLSVHRQVVVRKGELGLAVGAGLVVALGVGTMLGQVERRRRAARAAA